MDTKSPLFSGLFSFFNVYYFKLAAIDTLHKASYELSFIETEPDCIPHFKNDFDQAYHRTALRAYRLLTQIHKTKRLTSILRGQLLMEDHQIMASI